MINRNTNCSSFKWDSKADTEIQVAQRKKKSLEYFLRVSKIFIVVYSVLMLFTPIYAEDDNNFHFKSDTFIMIDRGGWQKNLQP